MTYQARHETTQDPLTFSRLEQVGAVGSLAIGVAAMVTAGVDQSASPLEKVVLIVTGLLADVGILASIGRVLSYRRQAPPSETTTV